MSHAEAERLISSRLDAPLDANQNSVLLAHLATCDSCRAFASSMETMSTEFRALPVLPASPVVTRQVRTRIAQQPSPWAWLSGVLFNGRWGAIPAAAAGVALVAVIAIALVLHGTDPNNGAEPLAAPTTNLAQASTTNESSRTPTGGNSTLNVAVSQTPKFVNVQVTSTPTPVDTVQPTETATSLPTETSTSVPTDTATAPPADTATAQPIDTATTLPVIVPTNTETTAPAPTETATETVVATPTVEPTEAPTETNTPEPTDAPTGTDTPEPTAVPTDTDTPTETATAEPTEAPTETATPAPTKTPKPTKTPTEPATETQEPATPVAESTDVPTRSATKKPTRAPEPTETPTSEPQGAPTIAPKDGGQTSQVIDTPASEQSTEASAPVDQATDTETPTDETSNSKIVPIGGVDSSGTDTPDAAPTETPKPDRKPTEKPTKVNSSVIDDAQQLAQMPAAIESGAIVRANPDGSLFVVADSAGSTVYDFNGTVISTIPGAQMPFWSVGGTAMLVSVPSSEGMHASIWSASTQSVFPIDASSDRGYVDYPAGGDGDSFYFVRSFADGIEVHRTLLDGNTNPDSAIWQSNDQLNGEPVVTDAGVVFAAGGSFWTVTPDGNGTKVGDDSFGDLHAPTQSPGGGIFAFIAGDQLVAASSSRPGSGAVIPSSGASGGFTFSPSGDQLAVASGDTLEVFGTDGSAQGTAVASNGASLTVVAWTSDGIIVVENGDQATLRLVSPDSLTSSGN